MREHEYQQRIEQWQKGIRKKEREGWCYIIGTEDKQHPYYKIGMAKNVNKRRSGIQSGSPWKLIVVRKWHTEDNELLEHMMHRMFVSKCVLNEWYELSKEDFDILEEIERLTETL